MDPGLADLLTDAFAETSVPSFPDGDLDFENFSFDEKFDEDMIDISHKDLQTKEDMAVHQEATGETLLSGEDLYTAENADVETPDGVRGFQGAGVVSVEKTPEEDYTSSGGESEEEGPASGEGDEEDEEEDEGPGDLLMSVHCGDGFYGGNKEDTVFAEGQPLAPEAAEKPQVRNKEQGDEEASYFGRVPGRGGQMMIKGDGTGEDEREREEEKQNWPETQCEDMKIEQEDLLARCFEQEVETPYRDEPAKATLEFPEISAESQQDLIAEVDTVENVEKIKDFSGEEHQEAGESVADYPSDFSSCEYVEDGGKNQEKGQLNASTRTTDLGSDAEQDARLRRTVTDVTWMGKAADTDEEGDGYLYSRDLEMDAERFMGLAVARGENSESSEHELGDAAVTGYDDGSETRESDSYSSSDDDYQVRKSYRDFLDDMSPQDPANNRRLEDTRLHSAESSRWSVSDDHYVTDYYGGADAAAFGINWDLGSSRHQELLTREETDVTLCPAEDPDSYLAVQREAARAANPSNRGSLDDSFFFNSHLGASGIHELRQFGDDEDEEESTWEQGQERIKAFYEFYDDSDGENGSEERHIKVQFCTDPLSRVILYDTDSSDRDSLSSSTEGEEDLSSGSEELREPDSSLQPACDLPNTELQESVPDIRDTQICTRKHKGLSVLKLALKMGLVIVMGLLMFCWATDTTGWLSPVHFFSG